MPKLNAKQKEFKEVYLIPFLKRHTAGELFETSEGKDILQHLKNLYPKKDDKAIKRLCEYIRLEITSKVETDKAQRIENGIQIKEKRTKRQTTKEAVNITIIEESEVVKHEIKKINFSSNLTAKTVEKIEIETEFTNNYLRDFIYQLEGGIGDYEDVYSKGRKSQRKRYKFPSLDTARVLREFIEREINFFKQEGLENIAAARLKEFANKVKDLEVAVKSMSSIDKTPLDILSIISENGFNRQKELQGAIFNDKAMVENGNIEIASKNKDEILEANIVNEDLEKLNQTIIQKNIESLS